MLELMKSMQEVMRTHGAKMGAETKAIRDKLYAHREKTETGLKPRETENKTDLEKTEASPEKMDAWIANMRHD
jgi:hypothetical protein